MSTRTRKQRALVNYSNRVFGQIVMDQYSLVKQGERRAERTMNDLPPLIKKPGWTYYVGIDVTLESKVEIFSFCVMGGPSADDLIIIHSDTVRNTYQYEADRKSKQYINLLGEFYKCKVLEEGL